ncbi:hypothetical protein QOT17_013181 [Balamuthia mandrillaris]
MVGGRECGRVVAVALLLGVLVAAVFISDVAGQTLHKSHYFKTRENKCRRDCPSVRWGQLSDCVASCISEECFHSQLQRPLERGEVDEREAFFIECVNNNGHKGRRVQRPSSPHSSEL